PAPPPASPAPAASNPRDTPAMRQYARFKAAHPGCILLFRIGDFYEMFDDDAVTVSRAIGLTLTQRSAGVPMAGMPYHQLEGYLRRLVAQGFRVAVCDQVQEAEQAKGLIERAVTRVLTPGTLVDESLLAEDRPSALAAVWIPPDASSAPASSSTADPTVCLAVADLSTGDFALARVAPAQLDAELARRGVTEILFPDSGDGQPPPLIARVAKVVSAAATGQPSWHFRQDEAREALCKHFSVASLGGFGFADTDPLLLPAAAIIRYLKATQSPDDSPVRAALAHLRPPRLHDHADYMVIDAASLRALEVDRTLRAGAAGAGAADPGSVAGSLLGIFSVASGPSGIPRPLCRTPMGRRLLRDWLVRPLIDLDRIQARQRCVATLIEDRRLADELATVLGGGGGGGGGGAAGSGARDWGSGVQDLARIAARIALRRCSPRDLASLGRGIARAAALAELLGNSAALSHLQAAMARAAHALGPLADRITTCCVDDPPGHLRDGGLFRPGVDAALDEARHLRDNAHQWLADYQRDLIAQHNLPSLKVGFNKVFGYYIELPRAQAARAPDAFTRKQTLTTGERYITPELKTFEDKVTRAEGDALAREQALFEDLCAAAAALLEPISAFADAVAQLDVLLCFADKASARGWVRPLLTPEPTLHIAAGRHPVLDELLEGRFVPNDVALGAGRPADANPSLARLALITGPNMAGKSTFIRQTALLVLLAQTGSFIPAQSATIGLCDRIFTRIGADDALHAGQSTFMVEMTETANILHHASERSLVVLDEIGRGTSTLDGLSLAWAIAERLAGNQSDSAPRPRTLFATHYHELTRLEETLPGRVLNLQVQVREWGDQIVFLHRIVPGRADRSYGIHVAKLAGIPSGVVTRAGELLESLSVEHGGSGVTASPAAAGSATAARASGTADTAARAERLKSAGKRKDPGGQLALFTEFVSHPAVDTLRALRIDALSPLQAFDELRRLKALAEGESAPPSAASAPPSGSAP
ncbi:MAG: DNA mismatch repair protein MutS, partial [Phycisphaerales bacterium]|nr:DNA mismatch repair protein MutS [Phycisphaerales bacterium]